MSNENQEKTEPNNWSYFQSIFNQTITKVQEISTIQTNQITNTISKGIDTIYEKLDPVYEKEKEIKRRQEVIESELTEEGREKEQKDNQTTLNTLENNQKQQENVQLNQIKLKTAEAAESFMSKIDQTFDLASNLFGSTFSKINETINKTNFDEIKTTLEESKVLEAGQKFFDQGLNALEILGNHAISVISVNN